MNFKNHVAKGLSDDRKVTLQLHRSLLEKDVQRLKSRLNYEIDLRRALESALGYGDESFESSIQNLPAEILKPLSDVALLETAVSKLENEVIHLRHHVGCARSERQIRETLVTQLQRKEDERSNLANKVEELKTKIYDIESEMKFEHQLQTAEIVEPTFLGLPLGLKKHPVQADARGNQKDRSLHIPKRSSFDDSNLNSSSRSKVKQETQTSSVKSSKALFSGKLYSSVDVPNIAHLLKSQSKFSPNRILKTIVSPAQKRPPSTRKKVEH